MPTYPTRKKPARDQVSRKKRKLQVHRQASKLLLREAALTGTLTDNGQEHVLWSSGGDYESTIVDDAGGPIRSRNFRAYLSQRALQLKLKPFFKMATSISSSQSCIASRMSVSICIMDFLSASSWLGSRSAVVGRRGPPELLRGPSPPRLKHVRYEADRFAGITEWI